MSRARTARVDLYEIDFARLERIGAAWPDVQPAPGFDPRLARVSVIARRLFEVAMAKAEADPSFLFSPLPSRRRR